MKLKLFAALLALFSLSCVAPEPVKPGSTDSLAGSYISEYIELFPKVQMKLNFQFDETGKKGTFIARIENQTSGNNYAENVGGEFENIADDPKQGLLIEQFPIPSSTGMYFVRGVGALQRSQGVLSTTLDITKRSDFQQYKVNFKPSLTR